MICALLYIDWGGGGGAERRGGAGELKGMGGGGLKGRGELGLGERGLGGAEICNHCDILLFSLCKWWHFGGEEVEPMLAGL